MTRRANTAKPNGGQALLKARGRKWFRFLGSAGAWKRWHGGAGEGKAAKGKR